MTTSTSPDVVRLASAIEAIEHNQVFDYLSKWSFERMLDDLAAAVRDVLQDALAIELGCSLFYRISEAGVNRYVIGGSSAQRTRIDPYARLYTVDRDAHERSFTALALRTGHPLAFDDFPQAVAVFADRITHRHKDCELASSLQKSYLAIPGPLDDAEFTDRAGSVLAGGADALLHAPRLADAELPQGLVRLVFSREGMGARVLQLFCGEMRGVLGRLFELIERGRRALSEQQSPAALAIADLNSNLLRYGSNEYQGLDALAQHLQTLFGDCECSIFRAVSVQDTVRLYLAATTALSNNEQHARFRRKFFGERAYYLCPRDSRLQDVKGKTAQAYYRRGEPVYDPACGGRGHFPGAGEWEISTSFLALAIPSRSPDGDPYGVIRLVRGAHSPPVDDPGLPFEEEDRRLAAAIAKTLNFWLEMFPRNDALEIEWMSDPLKEKALRTLFSIRNDDDNESREAGIELDSLLRKLFPRSTKIRILKDYSGFSDAAVLKVESDGGPDLIVKCATKVQMDASLPISHQNTVTDEVRNYREFVEGRIRLNHNMIYPETVRETRRVNGFASSFVGSGLRERHTLRELVATKIPPQELIRLVAASASHIVEGIWSWWYDRGEPRRSASAERFLREALLPGDLAWHLAHGRVHELDSDVLDASRKEDLKYILHDAERPSIFWGDFEAWAKTSPEIAWGECVTHGDLHGGNIFADPHTSEVWLIDFARTGRRASVFDLATLEAHLKFQLLPSLLMQRGLLKDQWSFVRCFMDVEKVLLSQRSYQELTLASAACEKNPGARDALAETVRTVTHLRMLLHDALRREGDMTDYWIVLLAHSVRYITIRATDGVSDHLRVLLSALSSRELVNVLIRSSPPGHTAKTLA